MSGLRRRASRRSAVGLVVVAVYFAVSCGLSPIEDLPSAADDMPDLDLDGGPLDLGSASGGSSAGTGGAPPCPAHPTTCNAGAPNTAGAAGAAGALGGEGGAGEGGAAGAPAEQSEP